MINSHFQATAIWSEMAKVEAEVRGCTQSPRWEQSITVYIGS